MAAARGHPALVGMRKAAMSQFRTTRWSLVAAAREESAGGRMALAELCAAYRPPVLAYLRR